MCVSNDCAPRSKLLRTESTPSNRRQQAHLRVGRNQSATGSVTVMYEGTTPSDVVDENFEREGAQTALSNADAPNFAVIALSGTRQLCDPSLSETLPNLHGLTRVARDLMP